MSKNLVVLLVFISFVCVFGSDEHLSSAGADVPNEMDVYRLPGDTTPVSYELNLTPDYNHIKDDIDYDGEVEILIDVKSTTSTITLNCNDILIYVVYVHVKISEDNVDVIEVRNDTENEQCKIFLKSNLQAGIQYVLNIEYHVNIKVNNMEGFYKSTYNNKNDHKE